MAPSASVCDECGKKFKVFAKKKRCKQCMDVMCKACVAPHVELKHTVLGTGRPSARRRHSLALLRASLDDEEDVQFLSPVHAGGAPSEFDSQRGRDALEGEDDGEAASDDEGEEEGAEEEEEEEDSFGDRDAGEEELLRLGDFARRASFEEDESQFRELVHIQEAVAKWAAREDAVRKQQRLAKHGARGGGAGFGVSPVPAACRSLVGFQDSDLFELLYAGAATVAVWVAFVLAYAAYLALRRDVHAVLLAMF